MRKQDGHEMRLLNYRLNRWGRMLELMRFWHGFPTIEATYRAFFGPSAYSNGRVPIPNLDSDVVQMNREIWKLKPRRRDVFITVYGRVSKETGGYLTLEEKARVLNMTVIEVRSELYFGKKQLLSTLEVVQSANLRSCHSVIEPAA